MATSDDFAGIAAGSDDGPQNPPAFYEHHQKVRKKIDTVPDGAREAREAMHELLTFIYTGVLDLYRKAFYIHRATREHLRQAAAQGGKQLPEAHRELFETIARHHEAYFRLPEGLPRVHELERQVQELWDGHQEEWHSAIEQITGTKLHRHKPDKPLPSESPRQRRR